MRGELARQREESTGCVYHRSSGILRLHDESADAPQPRRCRLGERRDRDELVGVPGQWQVADLFLELDQALRRRHDEKVFATSDARYLPGYPRTVR